MTTHALKLASRIFWLLLLCMCVLFVTSFTVAQEQELNPQQAKSLAIEHYNRLFNHTYYFNAADSKYHLYPKLRASYFDSIEETQCCWIVESEPPAGIYIRARVHKKNHWVEILRVGFNSE